MRAAYGIFAAIRLVQIREPVLPRFLRSPLPIASLLSVLGAGAMAPAIMVGRQLPAVAGLDNLGAPVLLTLFVTVPLAIAGVLAIAGSILMLRRRRLGKLLATIAVAIAVLYPLIAVAANVLTIASCGPAPLDCANRWFSVVTGLAGAGILSSLIAAVWYARLREHDAKPRAKSAKRGAAKFGRLR